MPTGVKTSRRWTDEEDKLLIEIASRELASGKDINWHRIASHISGRSNKDCRKRWIYALDPSVRKGPWSDEEDRLLLEGVQLHGFKWPLISQKVGTRQPDQCSRRWRETLNPSISHDRWTLVEDQLLKQAVDEYGRKWTEIVERYFPDRTPIAAKKRYTYRYEKRIKNKDIEPPKSTSEDSTSVSNGEEQDNASPRAVPAMLWCMPDYSQKRVWPPLAQTIEQGFKSTHLALPSTAPQVSNIPALASSITDIGESSTYESSTTLPSTIENHEIPDSDHHQPFRFDVVDIDEKLFERDTDFNGDACELGMTQEHSSAAYDWTVDVFDYIGGDSSVGWSSQHSIYY